MQVAAAAAAAPISLWAARLADALAAFLGAADCRSPWRPASACSCASAACVNPPS
eukprot:COSAG01_NODE_68181_length_265_cov_0.289157_1_plen_54_part_01